MQRMINIVQNFIQHRQTNYISTFNKVNQDARKKESDVIRAQSNGFK